MIGYDEALALIRAQCARLPCERIGAARALGRVLASAIDSGEDLPPFANSAMDGFALRVGSSPLDAGMQWDVIGASAAGDAQAHAGDGAWEIMTGACLPEGMDSVIPVEQIEVLARDADGRPARIALRAEVLPGQHVRRRGEDVARGARVIDAGTCLAAEHLAVLASLGVAEVEVIRRPRVALLNTGRELVDDPCQVLAPGQIRNSNGPLLAARLRAAGADLVAQQVVGDDAHAFVTALDEVLASGVDLVLSTGAVSMGRHDFIPDVLRAQGAQILFHKVRIRPGKPLLFAQLAGGALFFGLPGNPVSSVVGLRFFVEPALRVLLGMAQERALRVRLANSAGKPVALRRHLKARLHCDAQGQLTAQVLGGQESFKLAPLLQANAWVVIDEDAGEVAPGALVRIYGLGHLQSAGLEGWEA